jgi:multicomponent Na+:H+ antiporter subunit G
MDILSIVFIVMDILSIVFIVAGLFFLIVAAIGVIRLPDVFSRAHAVSLTDSLGAFLMLVGIALHEGLGKNSLKILVVLALLYILNPVIAHATVRAALRSGLKPWKKETS